METQRNSFRRFLERGIGEELLAISKIHGDRAQRVHKQKLKKLQTSKTVPTESFLDKRLATQSLEHRDITKEIKRRLSNLDRNITQRKNKDSIKELHG